MQVSYDFDLNNWNIGFAICPHKSKKGFSIMITILCFGFLLTPNSLHKET